MKAHLVFVLFAGLLAFGPPPADAQEAVPGNFLVAPSLFYYSGLRSKNSKEEKIFFVYELKLAYQVYPNVFAGLTYQSEEQNINNSGFSSPSDNNSSKGVRTSLGPSVGYVTPTYHAIFTYFYDSKDKIDTTSASAGSNKYSYSGNGMQLDLGYKIPIWGGFFGPQLSYKTYTYGKLSTNGGAANSISPKMKESNFEPSLTFFYFF